MKSTSKWLLVLAFHLVLARTAIAQIGTSPASDVEITASTDQERYLPGEVITLRVKIAPRGEDAYVFSPSVLMSSLRVQIAVPGGGYREYYGPGWGLADGTFKPARITRGRPFIHEVGILYQVPLSDRDDFVPEGIVFSKPGTYRIKVIALGAPPMQYEALPLTVIIAEPKGEDLAVWKQLSAARGIGALIQTGTLLRRDGRSTKVKEQLDALKQILAAHQGSRLAATLKRAEAKNAAVNAGEGAIDERDLTAPLPDEAAEE